MTTDIPCLQWPKRDSNSQSLRNDVLSVACLPVSPFGLLKKYSGQDSNLQTLGFKPSRSTAGVPEPIQRPIIKGIFLQHWLLPLLAA